MKSYDTLDDLNKHIDNCKRCPLYKTATLAVPGEGNKKANIMFIGEAPGRMEDETGRPFVGRAGKLLDSLLESIKIKREEVFITSVIKHRPPKNRPPKPFEVEACSLWLDHQLRLIQPKLICTLGKFGLEHFIPKAKISLLHGTIQKILKNKKEYMIFPLYHPAAALRSTRNKITLTQDFQKLKNTLNEIL